MSTNQCKVVPVVLHVVSSIVTQTMHPGKAVPVVSCTDECKAALVVLCLLHSVKKCQ